MGAADRWGELYARLQSAMGRRASRGQWGPAACWAAARLSDRWWAWWDRTHGDGADEAYRRANGLYGA